MLPEKSVFIGQKLVENAKIQKLKCDILGDFQTLCALKDIKNNVTFFTADPDQVGGCVINCNVSNQFLIYFWVSCIVIRV